MIMIFGLVRDPTWAHKKIMNFRVLAFQSRLLLVCQQCDILVEDFVLLSGAYLRPLNSVHTKVKTRFRVTFFAHQKRHLPRVPLNAFDCQKINSFSWQHLTHQATFPEDNKQTKTFTVYAFK